MVALNGSHDSYSVPLSASVPTGLRDCARINAFYFGSRGLMGVARIVTALGVRSLIQRGREAASEPS